MKKFKHYLFFCFSVFALSVNATNSNTQTSTKNAIVKTNDAVIPTVFTIDDIEYEINTDDNTTVTITDYTGTDTDINITNTVSYNNNNYTVTTIGEEAFSSNNLTTISIPSGVTTIGDSAFISNNLTSVTIPSSVTTIGDSAFAANNLTTISIPSGVTTIDDYAFYANNLTSVTIPSSVTTIGEEAFVENTLTLTSVISNIVDPSTAAVSSDAFFGVIENITLQVPTESISSYQTTAPWSSAKLIISNSAFTIDDIKYEINTDDNTTVTITHHTGYDTDVSIPSTVSYNNTTYTVTTIGDYAFNRNSLTSVTIPNSVTTIGDSAFKSNKLTTISIPSSVTTIESYAFFGNSLTSVTIPNSVTTIESHAFKFNKLTTISIPSGVTYIGEEVFAENSITSVISNIVDPSTATVESDAFDTIENITLQVPTESISSYQTTVPWSSAKLITDKTANVISVTTCQSPYTTADGTVYTASGTHTVTNTSTIDIYTVTLDENHTNKTEDSFTNSIVDTSESVDYTATSHLVSYLDFDKSNNRFVNVNNLQDNLNNTNRSVFMWIKKHTNVSTTSQVLFAINSSTGGNICNFQISTSETLQVYDGSNSQGNSITLDNDWHYVGYTYNNTTNETNIYLDGEIKETYTNDQSTTATSVYSLGQEYDSGLSEGNYFDGYMTEVSIWNEVLNELDIYYAMRSKIESTHTKYSNLVAYYATLPECENWDTTTLKDQSGNDNNGTLSTTDLWNRDFTEAIDTFNSAGWYNAKWYKNDVLFSENHETSFIPENGTHTYKLELSRDYITITDEWEITQNSVTLNIDNIDTTFISAYPNPTSDILNIETTMYIQNISLFNSVGQKVISQNTNSKQLSIKHLNTGIYLLSVTSANKTYTTRIVKN